MTYTRPISAALFASGLTAGSALGYTVRSAAGATLVERTTAGISEDGTSGIYTAAVANWDATWAGRIVWDAGADTLASEDFLPYAPQTGDSFDRIGANGSGLSAIAGLILATPGNKLATNPSGYVTATNGGSGGLDAAGVRAAIGLASANLDTQLAAKPDRAEFLTQDEAENVIASSAWTTVIDGLRADVMLTTIMASTSGVVDVESEPGIAIFMRTDGVTGQLRAGYGEAANRTDVVINEDAV